MFQLFFIFRANPDIFPSKGRPRKEERMKSLPERVYNSAKKKKVSKTKTEKQLEDSSNDLEIEKELQNVSFLNFLNYC